MNRTDNDSTVGEQFCELNKANEGAPHVGEHPVGATGNSDQPSETVQAQRTGFTALISRAVTAIKQFFTHHTERPTVSQSVPVFDPAFESSEYTNPLVEEGEDIFDLDESKELDEEGGVDDVSGEEKKAETPAAPAAEASAKAETPATSTPATPTTETPAAETPAETPAGTSAPAETPAPAEAPAAEAPAPAPTPAQTETPPKASSGKHSVGSTVKQFTAAVTKTLTSAASSVKHAAGKAVKHFTHHTTTPAKAAETPTAEAPAETETEAKAAGYKTASMDVGNTHVELCAKKPETLGEIAKILGNSNPNWNLTGETIPVGDDIQKLGFYDESVSKMSGICMSGFTVTGYITGNESKRQEALRGNEQSRAETGTFQSCQPPDPARIAGAKALVKIDSLVQTLKTCAARCTSTGDEQVVNEQKEARKQVMEELLNICNDSELQVATAERSVGGNNGYKSGGRVYQPLLVGLSTAFSGILMDPNTAKISSRRLQELAKDHGHEFVEQLVKTAYRTFPGKTNDRQELKAAYEEYCQQTGEKPTDLDGLLFNRELRRMLEETKQYTTEINKREWAVGTYSKEAKERDNMWEQRGMLEISFQYMINPALSNGNSCFGVKEDDGSITIDLGHIKIMVNEDQLKEVTLQSLMAL
ncbi:MAG: hypothetical protein LBF49_01025 [Puniceicoccales bacterium]|jgi:hypothetical protein|nr:hypothetical protein [Puniceicoccales bacterium]